MTFAKSLAALCLACGTLAAAPASADDCLMGEMKLFAGNFAPHNYAFAQGQDVSVQQNSALFSILGTTYGGDGQNSFKLPDMRGRVPIGAGQGPSLDNVNLGQKGGYAWTEGRQANVQSGQGATVAAAGPITNMQPSTGLNYIICINGEFPSR